jgi:hypothetical protein
VQRVEDQIGQAIPEGKRQRHFRYGLRQIGKERAIAGRLGDVLNSRARHQVVERALV